MDKVLLQSTKALLRSAILVCGSYAGLILFLRLSGERTLAKMNSFDLVVTVALGSTLATIGLSKDIALLQALLVLALLILLQLCVAWVTVRVRKFENLIKAETTLLLHKGEFLREEMKQERVTEEEIYAAVRGQGCADLKEVLAVVLETDGSFSVIRANAGKISSPTLKDVHQNRASEQRQ